MNSGWHKTHIKKHHLYLTLSTLWLTACNGGGTSTSNTSSANTAASYTLNNYISQLQYIPKTGQNVVTTQSIMPMSGGMSFQESFVASTITTLTEVDVHYYSGSSCSGSPLFTTTLTAKAPATSLRLDAGTYASSDKANFALCSFYGTGISNPENCTTEFGAVSSIQYVYKQLSGNTTTSSCLTNQRIADYSGDSPVACTSATSCGFSQAYQTNITYIPLNIFFVGNHNGNLGGISGADNICEAAVPGQGLSGTYKAFITNGTGSLAGKRIACTSSNCSTGGVKENVNWILYPLTTYQWSSSHGTIFTTNGSGIYQFGKLSSVSQYANPVFLWSGFKSSDWTTPSANTNSNCDGWTNDNGTRRGYTGVVTAGGGGGNKQTNNSSYAAWIIRNHPSTEGSQSTGGEFCDATSAEVGVLCVQQ